MSHDQKPFLPLRTLAWKLGIPEAAVRRWAQAGEIPFVQAGKSMMFNTDEVIRVLNAKAKANAEEAAKDGGAA